MSKKIIILGATGNQVPMVKTAKEMGLYVVTMDWDLNNMAHRYSDQAVEISTVDEGAVLDWAKQNKIDGVTTCASDISLLTQAFVCEKLNLNSPSTQAVTQTIYKSNFREFQKINGLPHPEFFVFSDPDDAVQIIKNLTKKYVIKPVDSSGSKGILVVDFSKNISIEELKEIINNTFEFSRNSQIIVEEFLVGKDYTIEGFYKNGKIDYFVLTEKELTEYPYRIPVGHFAPAPILNELYERLQLLIEDYMSKLNVETSPFDMDLIVCPDKSLYIIEMSLRIGGNALPSIMLHSTGYNLCRTVISYALDLTHDEKPIKNEPVIGRLIVADMDGIIKDIADKDFLLKKFKPHLKEVEYDFNIGDRVFKFKQGNHRLGHYIVQGKNRKQINEIYQNIEKEMKLTIIPEKSKETNVR